MQPESQAKVDTVEVRPLSKPMDADIELPGSKSLTNRALPLAALAEGTSTIRQALFSDDTRYMTEALNTLGAGVEADLDECTYIIGGAAGRIPSRGAEIFVGNSGTSARFLTALLATAEGEFVLDGVPRMRQRPIEPLLAALRGLNIEAESIEGTGCPPVLVRSRRLTGGTTTIDGSESSQFLSALLMVAPVSRDGIEINVAGDLVSKPYIDMTLAAIEDFGGRVERDEYRRFIVPGGQRYQARDYTIEPDASAASYFFALAAASGGRVRVAHLGTKSRQGDMGFLDVLERMGCEVVRAEDFTEVRGPRQLRGVEVDMNAISDTAQTLAAIAPLAEEPVAIRNVAHIRAKETDRLDALVTELRRLGVEVRELQDGLVVLPSPVQPGRVETYDDHRMAMSFAVLGCLTPGISIANPGCVAKTFPEFFKTLAAATDEQRG